jgi:hypothetical protein
MSEAIEAANQLLENLPESLPGSVDSDEGASDVFRVFLDHTQALGNVLGAPARRTVILTSTQVLALQVMIGDVLDNEHEALSIDPTDTLETRLDLPGISGDLEDVAKAIGPVDQGPAS